MQTNIFEFIKPQFKIDKKIRLIELFGGIGSQAKALENLGVDFEHYKLIEIDPVCVKSYNAIHNTNFISQDITKIHASDLAICDTYLLTYLLTYSFPCQDLSLAGKREGMQKDSGTRSGLLWEVERILKECKELPQVLLMENVPQVHSKQNIKDFVKWVDVLESLGYSNYWQDLNAKDYGIPQNRKRCFMISILGNYSYVFPKKQKLKLCLRDMLEKNVDEKYFLTSKQIQDIINWKAQEKPLNSLKNTICKTITTRSGEYTSGMQLVYDTLPIKNATSKGYLIAENGDGIDISGRMQYHRGTVQKGMAQTLTTQSNVGVVVKKDTNNYIEWEQKGRLDIDCRAWKEDSIAPTTTTTPNTKVLLSDLTIRRLTPKENWRLMGFTDADFEKASQVCSNSQLNAQAGNSIVVNVLMAIFKQLF